MSLNEHNNDNNANAHFKRDSNVQGNTVSFVLHVKRSAAITLCKCASVK